MKSISQVFTAAMPTAPPRLRSRLLKPEASFSSSSGMSFSAMPTTGTMVKSTATPRTACGQNSSQNPQSGPSADIIQNEIT